MPYTFRCELCGTVTEDADFSGPGCACEGCGLVYQVCPTAESLKMVLARKIQACRCKPKETPIDIPSLPAQTIH